MVGVLGTREARYLSISYNHLALNHGRVIPSAERGVPDLDDYVRRLLNLRQWALLDCNLKLAVEHNCLHCGTSICHD
jgi:hypothetical protein